MNTGSYFIFNSLNNQEIELAVVDIVIARIPQFLRRCHFP